jgi:ATP-binding cassette, subfamily B, bacterial PglK
LRTSRFKRLQSRGSERYDIANGAKKRGRMPRNLIRILRLLDGAAIRAGLVAGFAMIVSAGLEAVGVAGLVLVMRVADDRSNISTPVLRTVQAHVGITSARDFGLFLCAVVVALYAAKNCMLVLTNLLQARFGTHIRLLICRRLFAWFLRRPYGDHLLDKQTELVSLVVTDTEHVALFTVVPLLVIATEVLAIAAVFSVGFSLYPLPSLGLLLMLGAIPTAIYALFIRPQTLAAGAQIFKTKLELQRILFHSLGSLKEIRVAEREPFFSERFDHAVEQNARHIAREAVLLKLMPPLIELLVAIVLIGVAARSLLANDGISSSIPMLTLFGAAAVRLLPSVFRVAQALHLLAYSKTPVTAVLDQLDRIVPERTIGGPTGKEPFLRLQLDHVFFRYERASDRSLRDVSLTIQSGEIIGLVGPSGAGKTTLADIILGILPPSAGAVLINGRSLATDKIRPVHMSYIPQETYFLDDTLRRNIAFGVPDRKIDESRLRRAIAQARLEPVIAKLARGIDSVLGERGIGLSGGERQRLALARALYDEADILVLDEATSALDAEAEADVTAAIYGLRGQRTCIIIAHRLSSVRDCDRLYYLENGAIIGSGSFHELMSRVPGFRQMVERGQLEAGPPTAAQ